MKCAKSRVGCSYCGGKDACEIYKALKKLEAQKK